jgi:hypothetical protein
MTLVGYYSALIRSTSLDLPVTYTVALRYIVAVLHLFALAIGLAAVYGRWRALRRVRSTADLGDVANAF